MLFWPKHFFSFKQSEPPPQLRVCVKFCGLIFRGKDMSIVIPRDKSAQISIAPVDATGNAAAVEEILFSSSDEAVVVVDATGIINPVGVGDAVITVIADALIGEGIENIYGTLDVKVISSQATRIDVTATLNP